MKLSVLVSPGTWELIERLRPHLDVTIDLFDASLAPAVPDLDHPVSRALRQLPREDGDPAARERFVLAVRTANTQLFSAAGLRVGVFPLRHARTVVGVLAAAMSLEPQRRRADPDRRRAEALASADSDPGTRRAEALAPADITRPADATETMSTRIERLGWSLRATIESDIETHAQLTDEQQRSRWLATTLRFLEHLYAYDDERELAAALVQAAGIWADVDPRIYRRELAGDYVLHTALPAIEAVAEPRRLSGASVAGLSVPARVTSIAELEQLGWRGAHGEVLFMPISATEPIDPGESDSSPDVERERADPALRRSDAHLPAWLLAVGGEVDPTFERVLTAACRTLATRLHQVATAQVASLRAELAAQLARWDLKPPAQAAAALAQIANAVRATRARLLASDTVTGGPLRVLAAVGGGPLAAEDASPVDPDPGPHPTLTPTRLVLPIRSGTHVEGLLELTTLEGQPFGPEALDGAQVGVDALALWLAGALRSLSFAGLVPTEAPSGGFEVRIAQELERARRFDLEVGLLLVDTDPSLRSRHALVLEPILSAIRSQLRGSDALGRLTDGAVAVLLAQTGAGGVNAAAARVEQQLAWLASDGRVPQPVVGRAAYPATGESVQALLSAARGDRERRATAMKHELPG